MALVDVTSLLHDPDFIDALALVSRKQSINSLGEGIMQEISTPTYGSVQPASGRALQRLPDFLRMANVSSFWLKGQIVACEPGKYTDIIVFRGQRYQVQTVSDWTNWGEGWCEGTCVMEVPAP